jgi:hypothetical protein
MTSEEAARGLADAFEHGRVEVTRHFWDELRADAFDFADVRCAVEEIVNVAAMGHDRAGNPKFEITGTAVDGRRLSLVCSFKPTGAVLLITVYEAE